MWRNPTQHRSQLKAALEAYLDGLLPRVRETFLFDGTASLFGWNATGAATDAEAVVHLKVWLIGIGPIIRRRVLVSAAFTLRELHGVIQAAMEVGNFRLFHFCRRAVRNGALDVSIWSLDVTLA